MGIGWQRQSKHLRWAGFLFITDFFLVWISFLTGIFIRFGVISFEKLIQYGPGIAVASLVLPSIFYIGGLYSARSIDSDWIKQLRWLVFGFSGVVISVLAVGSLDFSSRVGRGVMLGAMAVLTIVVIVRHLIVFRKRAGQYKTYLCMVTSNEEEKVAVKLSEYWGGVAETFGIVTGDDYVPDSTLPHMGEIGGIRENRLRLKLDVILVRDRHFANKEIASFLRELRYEGVDIVPLSDACEDAYHAVPLEIITDSWLFRSSNQSQLFYIRKMKRLSDVVWASIFIVLLSPFLAIGAMIVKLASPGAVIFKQKRAGRFGRHITVLKLRTMHVAGDANKARWATEEEARIFPLGRILRQFRVDEIPQLINVLKGDMSFVGPRPEQVSFVEELGKVVPFYKDRLMIQPGITGWAQVNYPYGASVDDAARKLEYDLYYMKHMGLFFDFVILLETVKTIVWGGVRKGGDTDYLQFREDMDSISEEIDAIREDSSSKEANRVP